MSPDPSTDDDPADDQIDGTQRTSARAETTKSIRGSSLLLVGRIVAIGLNFAIQVLVVRVLSKADYGAFAYGLSIVSFARTAVSLGHTRAVTRFLSIYEEEDDRGKLFGTLLMEATLILGMGVVLTLGVLALQGPIAASAGQRTAEVVAVMILLAPVEAFDDLAEAVFAVYSRPRAIFARKYILTPLMRLGAVALLLVLEVGVIVLALGYVIAGALGLLVYAAMLSNLFRRRGLLAGLSLRSLSMPFREVFTFALPLLTHELVVISMNTVSVVLLGHFKTEEAVANFRSVFPVARLNHFVQWSFALLFVPLASRLYSRRDHEEMQRTYWQTAAWLAVFSFPAFVLTFPLALPTTVTLFGERYVSSSAVLALLGLGYYLNVCFGFNVQTLHVYGRLGWIAGANGFVAVLNVGLSLLLIPRYGAVGVAMAHAVTLFTQNLANHLGLRGLGFRLMDLGYVRIYLSVAAGIAGVWAVQQIVRPPAIVSFALAAAVSVGMVLVNRRSLRVVETFPELGRLPVIGRLLATPRRPEELEP
ncbi:MAG: oligosaccharide flippase family protein [Actinobacteria bacterium]|nr:oligosaccharide flippase family protein [Actinomycetota bacterium]